MAEYRKPQYINQQTVTEQDQMGVTTSSQGYHEIKVYNDTKDSMWTIASKIEQASNESEILAFADQLHLVLLRADSIWNGIDEAVKMKAAKMRIGQAKNFKYDNEMLKQATKLEKYIDFIKRPTKFLNQYNEMDAEYRDFLQKNTAEMRPEVLKQKITEIVRETDAQWNKFAAAIGAGLPLQIAEDRDIFFRGF